MHYKDYAGALKGIIAAQSLLLEPTTTKEKFASIQTLLKGIHPQIDVALQQCVDGFSTLDKALYGDIVSLSADKLPEATEEEKRRKKALLFFLVSWNKLKSEVARVQKELEGASDAETGGEKISHWRKIINFAKGPFGVITIVAVGIALAMQAVSVHVVIANQGCSPIITNGVLPFSIPGLALPKEPIESGTSATATVPGLTFTVDGMQQGILVVRVLGFSADFQVSDGTDVQLDGTSLLGTETTVRLSNKKEHELTLVCGR